MAYIESTYPIILTSGGGTVNLAVTDSYGAYDISGTATLAANWVIQPSGTAITYTKFVFNYDATITLNSNTITIFGLSMTDEQALKPCVIESKYDGSTWQTKLLPDFEGGETIETSDIANDAVNEDKINVSVAGSGLSGGGGTALSVNVDNTGIEISADTLQLKNNGVSNAKLATMANNTMKANISGSTATPSDVSISTLLNSFGWKVTGNSGTTPGTNFIGTTDNKDLVFKANSTQCGKIDLSLNNTAFGYDALSYSSITGDLNVAIGTQSLLVNDTGYNNTGVGHLSLYSNTFGFKNTAIGKSSLQNLESGESNVGLGEVTGATLTTGNYNTIIGATANVTSASSSKRIAIGYGASADQDAMFALPNDVTKFKWRGVTYTMPSANAAGVLTNDGSGNLSWV